MLLSIWYSTKYGITQVIRTMKGWLLSCNFKMLYSSSNLVLEIFMEQNILYYKVKVTLC